ncbi:MAG: MerR family transcriptional regulator [Halobacteriovorax sp.]|nr:MerR family transcriptional regulator [Halobacteriovorax sp.]
MIQLPNKSHFKADEVCGFTGVKPYVLRFWETEFEEISPVVSSSGQKLYEQRDVEAILAIKKLLFDDKLTVEQARHEMTMRFSKSDESEIETEETHEAATQMRGFDGSEVKKLSEAKQKLAELVSLTQAVQERHHWAQ